ncbi:hypothetical protein FAI41_04795 [Acetobacteraceae bacterium]|nr:hypothetical protein FAI41_04795 [Acetobacteraceae bacterium]
MKYLRFLPLLFCAACSQPAVVSVCPALIPYSADQQKGLFTELSQHPDLKYVPLFLEGYAQTRDALRSLSMPKDNLKA